MYRNGSRSDAGVDCAVHAVYITCSGRLPSESAIFIADFSLMKLALCCIESTFNNRRYKAFVIFSDFRSSLEKIRNITAVHPLVCKILKWLAVHCRHGRDVRYFWFPFHVGVEENKKVDEVTKAFTRLNHLHRGTLP